MRHTLPSNSGAWVDIEAGRVLLKDTASLVDMVTRAIRAWNITDEQDNPLPITRETVGSLVYSDVEYLHSQIDTSPPKRMIKDIILALNNDNPANDMPVPLEYIKYKYRREMGLTPAELEMIPLSIFEQDLQFINIEQQVRRNDATT